MISDICGEAHRLFVATDGTVEGASTIKIYAVVVCTVCGHSKLVEHIMLKDAAQLTK
jgi:hypothetical protein